MAQATCGNVELTTIHTQEADMPSPSPEIIQLLAVFSVTFTTPTLTKVLVLIFGTILTVNPRV